MISLSLGSLVDVGRVSLAKSSRGSSCQLQADFQADIRNSGIVILHHNGFHYRKLRTIVGFESTLIVAELKEASTAPLLLQYALNVFLSTQQDTLIFYYY